MTDWMTIRVVLLGRRGMPLPRPPGRVLLAHADHSFADLSEAADVAFGRWDLSPPHEFAVEGRRLTSDAVAGTVEVDAEDSAEVTLGEVGLRLATWFTYLFDSEAGWTHDCRVEAVDVDPFAEYGEEPDGPVPVYGWGDIPDQYGRLTEGGEEVSAEDDTATAGAVIGSPADAEQAMWPVVEQALAAVDRPADEEALASAAEQLRARRDNDEWPYDVLWAAAGLDDDDAWDAVLERDDAVLWLALAAGVVAPLGALPLDPETEAAWAALEPADWAGAVIELARAGVGQPADPATLLELIARCPEIESDPLSPEDKEALLGGLETVTQLWTALGALDEDRALTALGRWGLPEGLRHAWTGSRPD